LVVDRKASIHDNCNPGRFEAPCYFVVPYSLLHPDQLRVDFEKLLQQRWNVLGTPEDVDDVDWSTGGGRAQVRVHWLTKGDAARRVNGHNGVTGPLEICRYTVTRPFRFAAKSDDCYTPGITHQLCQPAAIRWHLVLPPHGDAGVH
jgi:hypothetical protein